MNELLQFFSAMWPLPINLQGLYLGGLFNGIVLFGGLYVWKKVILKKYKDHGTVMAAKPKDERIMMA